MRLFLPVDVKIQTFSHTNVKKNHKKREMKIKIEEKCKKKKKKSESKYSFAGLENPAALVWRCCGLLLS